jgi:restriction system protein
LLGADTWGRILVARHKNKNAVALPVQMLLVVAAIASCVWVIQHELSLVLLVGIIAGAVVIAKRFILPARRRRAIVEKADQIIQEHADQLARRRAQLVREDAYGKPVLDKWRAEIDHFTAQHIRPSLAAHEQLILDGGRMEFFPLVAARIDELVPKRAAFEAFTASMRPSEFEIFCAEQLQEAGWSARVTQASRDQGVDVIAQKGDVRVVLQCKLYSNPVGNKAVQEIVAGRTHEQANYGAVVTNNTYTTSAEELASTNGILLQHYSDLPQLDTFLERVPLTQSAKVGQ